MSKDKKPVSATHPGTTRIRSGKRKKRRIKRLRVAIMVFVLVLIATGVTMVLMMNYPSAQPVSNESNSRSQAVFGVKTIVVEGNTKYSNEEIIESSGVYIGQSMFFVNKRQAAKNILQTFPYVEKVSIDSPSFNQIKITIDEAEPIGVVHMNENWIILGENGKGLELLPADSERIASYLQIKCVTLSDTGVGHMLMDDRSFSIITTLDAAFESYGLEGILEIDVSDFTDIRLNWKNQITIALGNDSNLAHEIGVAKSTIESVLKSRGENANGRLDLSFYSDSNANNDQVIFTPQELLTATTTAP